LTDAPDPPDRPWSYDRAVTRGFFRGEHPSDGPVVDLRSLLYVAGGVAVIAVGSLTYRAPVALRILVAAAILVAGSLLILGMKRIYMRSLVRAHRSVVDRPELGDRRRWATFALPLVVWPVLVLAALIGGIALIQEVTASGPGADPLASVAPTGTGAPTMPDTASLRSVRGVSADS
jgi:hypothetical protein